MPTTLKLQSFALSNLRERTALSADAVIGAESLAVESSEGYVAGQVIYIGVLGREGCEKAAIDAVPDETTIDLVSPIGLAHSRFEAVTAVLGDRIRIYRAVNVVDTAPEVEAFTALGSRSIDADQVDTYYTDSTGSSDYWYRHTYFNETTLDETELLEFPAVRGDDFARYATVENIRIEAGFQNAQNLSDNDVDIQRRTAESEVNSALTGVYEVPFKKPIPSLVTTIVEKLAAGFLLQNAYSDSSKGDTKVKDARAILARYKDGSDTISPEDGGVDVRGDSIFSWPDDTTDSTPVRDGGGKRIFHIGDTF